MGLERVALVHSRMDAALTCPVVTVTGTNGKGSTCAMLESIFRCAGHRTGLYTSPHLTRYNERVKVDGEAQDDDALIDAFNAVEDARGDVPLTYFEYGTLAALRIFARCEARRRGAGGRVGRTGSTPSTSSMPTSRSSRASISITSTTSVRRARTSAARKPASSARRDRWFAPIRILRRRSSRTRARWARRSCRSGATTATSRRIGSGNTGVRAGGGTDCRFRRCAARISSPMPRRRSPRSICCATGCMSAPARSATD